MPEFREMMNKMHTFLEESSRRGAWRARCLVAAVLALNTAACSFGWGMASPPAPEKAEASESKEAEADPPETQVGWSVADSTIAPPSIRGAENLGMVFNNKLQLLSRTPVYEALPQRIPRGEVVDDWTFVDRRSGSRGGGKIGILGVAAIGAGLSNEQGQAYAIYTFEEIDHCMVIDEAVEFVPPPKGRFFPVEVCFGRRYSRIFSSSSRTFTRSLGLDLLSVDLSGNYEEELRERQVQVRERAEGLTRKRNCGTVDFSDPGIALSTCFEADESVLVPVRVRWREIKRDGQKRRGRPRAPQAQCLGTGPECAPCKMWEFTRAEYSPDKKGLELYLHFTDPAGSKQTIQNRGSKVVVEPILARPGQSVGFLVQDEEWGGLAGREFIERGEIKVRKKHVDGRARGGRMSLVGTCIE